MPLLSAALLLLLTILLLLDGGSVKRIFASVSTFRPSCKYASRICSSDASEGIWNTSLYKSTVNACELLLVVEDNDDTGDTGRPYTSVIVSI